MTSARAATTLALIAVATACGSSGSTADDADPGDADGGGGDADGDPTCPSFGAPAEVGLFLGGARAISGLAVSHTNPGILWIHDDYPGTTALYGITADGDHETTMTLSEAAADAEDLARGPGPVAGDHLYLADVGDNSLARDAIALLRVAEPTLASPPDDVDATVDVIHLTYDDGARHDAEAIFVEPDSGALYLITKRDDLDPTTRVYRGAGITEAADGAVIELETILTEADQPALDGRVVSADLSPDGAWILVGIKDEAYVLWPRRDGSIEDALRGAPCAAPRGTGKIETGAFADGGYYMMAEGTDPAVQFAAQRGD